MSKEPEESMEKGEWDAPEEAASAVAAEAKTKDTTAKAPKESSNKSAWMILIAVAIIAAIGLVVGLSVGLTRKDPSPSPAVVPVPTPTSSQPEPSPTDSSPPEPAPTDALGTNTVPTNPGVIETNTGVFDARLATFSSDVLRGYDTVTELEEDLEEVFKFMTDAVILADAGEPNYNEPFWSFPCGGLVFATADGSADESGSPSAQGVDDFETVNQEEGVDEADIVKANKDYVFLAYGDMLVVYEARSGTLVTNLTMPAIQEEPSISDGSGIDIAQASAKSSFYWGPIRPQIKALMLNGDRLVCVTGNYAGSSHWWGFGGGGEDEEIFSNVDDTLISIYDISKLNTTNQLVKVSEEYVSGSYDAGRSVENNSHVVTTSHINFCPLVGPLRRWNGNFSEDDEEYKTEAKEIAEDLIANYTKQFVGELNDLGVTDALDRLLRIALWDTATSDEASKTINNAHGGLVFSSYSQITSFDMSSKEDQLALSISGAFVPSIWRDTYSTKDMMILAGNGYDWTADGYIEKTYLIGFKLGGAASSPAAVGAVPGRILDQYSVSIFEGHLRVATTISVWNWWSDETFNDDESRTQNQFFILDIPDVEDSDEGIFTEVSRLEKLGEKDERFTTVRMYGDIGYAVTFLQTDPFYVLSLVPNNPQRLGELKITGFSTQLYPFDSDNKLLVSLGFEADDNGVTTGFAISMFDSTNHSNPTLVDRFVVEDDDDVWSFSAGSWDTKAARLVKIDDDNAIFIVPLTIYQPYPATEGNFDGFAAYDINRTNISERLRVSHVQSEYFYDCYYPAYLPPRSLVYDGNMHTMKGHSVLSTNLDTGEEQFNLSLYKPEDGDEICVNWLE